MTYGRLVESKSALRQEVRCQWQRAQQTCLLRMAAKTRRLNWPTLERGLRLPEQIQKPGSTASPGTTASNQQAAPCVQASTTKLRDASHHAATPHSSIADGVQRSAPSHV
ncbi:hypothetical protein ACCO45_004283 [Purpureocillium lilacinum]|uniref:Uncharacterized protein n=1 Tax=Purpureocillium lilacinum TaxID=33203 RepID=A0ACC4E297_PURLI